MKRRHLALAAVSLLVSSLELRAESTLPKVLQVVGQVTAASRPVDEAMIVAFGLRNFSSHQASSDATGAFRLASIPTDVYRLIAIKRGFAPAVATVVPSAGDLRVQIRLKEGKASPEVASQIWEVRRSLPSDVLRELDAVMGESIDAPTDEAFRFGGEMESLTGSARPGVGADLMQTQVALRGTSSSGWSVDIAGRMQQFEGDDQLAKEGESRGIVMNVRTSPEQTLRIASLRNSMRIDQEAGAPGVDFESHRFQWSRPETNVEVRYQTQQNLYRSPLLNSEILEVSGSRQLLHSERTNLDVRVQVWQESLPSAASISPAFRVANLGTSGSYSFGETADLHYGLRTRITELGQQWTPETGAKLSLTKSTSLIASGSYTIGERLQEFTLPSVMSSREFSSSVTPRYRYTFGVVSADRKGNELSAVMSVAAIDSMVNMLFDEGSSGAGLWDGYLLAAGDVHRDVTITWRRNVHDRLYVDVATTAAQTNSAAAPGEVTRHHYVVSQVRSLYRPSGTSMEVTYRAVEQPDSELSYVDGSGERLNLRLGQSLHLPLDLRVLVGLDVARDRTVITQPLQELQYRYLGGLSLAF